MSIMDELKKLTRPYDDDSALIDDDMDLDMEDSVEAPVYTRPVAQPAAAPAAAPTEPINMGGMTGMGAAPMGGASEQPRPAGAMNLGGLGGLGSDITKYRVVLVQPEKFDYATGIADHLLNGNAVILNCETTDKDVARRVVDFLSGCAYALKGDIKKAANNVYILVPRDVGVDAAAKEEDED